MAGRVFSNLSAILNVGNNDRSTVEEKQNRRMKPKETCPVGSLKNSVVKIFFVSRDYSRTRPWETRAKRRTGTGMSIYITWKLYSSSRMLSFIYIYIGLQLCRICYLGKKNSYKRSCGGNTE